MWGAIFNMAVEGLGKYTAIASGIFMTMVFGCAVMMFVQATVADLTDYITSFWVVVFCAAYILFYAGEVNSLFQGVSENFSLNDPDIEKLGSERVNIFNNKTYFDLVYDTIYEDNNFDNFETENLNYLKNTLTKGDENSIIKYYDDYKDLF